MAKDIEVEIFLKGGKRFSRDVKKTGKASSDASKGFSKAQASLISLSAAFNLVSQAARVVKSVVRVFVDVGGAAVKAGSDFEEASQKFGVVFAGVQEASREMRDNLARDFGLSTLAATELLSATGDLLTGFGFTDKAALELSNSVNKLAVDLASFSNIEGGAERVSRILTKSLLGERESLKELGISILEADVKARILAKGQDKLTGSTLRAARSQATFELILEQSTKAQGDFARSSTQLANQQRILDARIEDVSVQLGQVLVPIVQVFVKELITIAEKTIDWAEANKEIIASNIIGFTKELVSVFGFLSGAALFVINRFADFLITINIVKSGLASLGIIATQTIQFILDGFALFARTVTRFINAPLKEIKKLFIEFALDINEILADVIDFGSAIIPDSVINTVKGNVKILKDQLRSLNEGAPTPDDNKISKFLEGISGELDVNISLLSKFKKENEDSALAIADTVKGLGELEKKINTVNSSIQSGLSEIQKEAEAGNLFKAKLSELAAIGEAEQVAAAERKQIAAKELVERREAVSAFNQFVNNTEQGQVEEANRRAILRLDGLKSELEEKKISIEDANAFEAEIETTKQEEIKAIRDSFREQELEADQTFQEALREQFGVTMDEFRDRGEIATAGFRDFSVDALQSVKDASDDLFTNMILGTGNTKEAFLSLGKSILKSFIGTLTDMLVKQILFKKSSDIIESQSAISRILASASSGGAAAYASVLSALPFPVNIGVAPAVAATQAASISAFTAGAAIRAQAGISVVDRAEQPALLHLGETVLTRDETGTLSDFLGELSTESGAGAGGVSVVLEIENLTLLADDDAAIGALTEAITRKLEEQNFVGFGT